MPDDLLRQLKLGSMDLFGSGNICALTATGIVGPFRRQVQPRVNDADSIRAPECTEHSDLAVVLFPKASIPLARHVYRLVAFLLKGTFIDIQPRAELAAEQRVRVSSHFVDDRAIAPRRVRQKILQHLVIAVRNRLDHALHVPLLCLHQAAHVLLCCLDHAVVAGAKLLREAVVTPAGRIVWEYVSPFVGQAPRGLPVKDVPWVYRVQAVPYNWLAVG